MKKNSALFLPLFLITSILFSQEIEQPKVIARNSIAEQYTYKNTLENGQPTGETVLIGIKRYNSLGFTLLDSNIIKKYNVYYTTNEYMDDSIVTKSHVYGTNGLATYLNFYDSLGRLETVKSPYSRTDSLWTVFKYDHRNRVKDMYTGTTHEGKLYHIKTYQYDDMNNKAKINHIHIKNMRTPKESEEVRERTEEEYDQNKNLLGRYRLKKRKRLPIQLNTYNQSGQLTATTYVFETVPTNYLEIDPDSEDKTCTYKYFYDKDGLLVRTEVYNDKKLFQLHTYRYVQ